MRVPIWSLDPPPPSQAGTHGGTPGQARTPCRPLDSHDFPLPKLRAGGSNPPFRSH
jgi:hypothetical protein